MADNIHVAVRVRKLINREKDAKEVVHWEVQGNNSIMQIDKNGIPVGEIPFVYDRVFNPDETTDDVYAEICKPIVNSVMKGFNGTIFAYGQTSSGKTYTMKGNPKEHGVIIYTISEIFDAIENTPDREFLLRLSYMEIYNEKIADLLSKNPTSLKIKENIDGQVFVANLTEEMVKSAEEVMMVMQRGEAKRHIGETCMNEKSSRSHAIFRMIIESRPVGVGPNEAVLVHVSHLNLIDLAGSERTGQMGTSGDRFKEGVNINKSLLMLGHVISTLSEGEGSFVNFRGSKLTRILQNSLGGNAKTAIICTVTPVSMEQTRSTLNFASRAKKVTNRPVVNEIISDAALLNLRQKKIRQLELELQEMKKCDNQLKVDAMEKQLQEKERKISELQGLIEKMKTHVLVSSRTLDDAQQPLSRKLRRETWGGCLRRNKPSLSLAVPFIPIMPRHEREERQPRLSNISEEVMPKQLEEDSYSVEDSFHTKDFRESHEFLAEMNKISDTFALEESLSLIATRKQQEQTQIISALEQKVEELSRTNIKKQQEQSQIIAALEQKVKELENQYNACKDFNRNLEIDCNELHEFTQHEKQLYGEQPQSLVEKLKNLEKTNKDSQLMLRDSSKHVRELQTENLMVKDSIEKEREKNREEKAQLIQKNKELLLNWESRGKQLLELEEKMKLMEQDQKDVVLHLELKWKSRDDELCKQLEKAYRDLSKGENGEAPQRLTEYEENLKTLKEELLKSEKVIAELQEKISLNHSKIAVLEKENDSLKVCVSEKKAHQHISEVVSSTQTSFTQSLDTSHAMQETMHVAGVIEQLLVQFRNFSDTFKMPSVIEGSSCETSSQELSNTSGEKLLTDVKKDSLRTETIDVSSDVMGGSSILQVQSTDRGSFHRNVSLLQSVALSAKEELSKLAIEKEQLVSSLTVAQSANKELENQLVCLETRQSELLELKSEKEQLVSSLAVAESANRDLEARLALLETRECSFLELATEKEQLVSSVIVAESANKELKDQLAVLQKRESELVELVTEKEQLMSSLAVSECANRDLQNQLAVLKTRESELMASLAELETTAESKVSLHRDNYTQVDDQLMAVPEFESLRAESDDMKLSNASGNLRNLEEEKELLQERFIELENDSQTMKDVIQGLEGLEAESDDLKQKLSNASAHVRSLSEENELLRKRCIELENGSQEINNGSCIETLNQLELERELLADKQEQLKTEKKNLLHALLENDKLKKQLVEIKLADDDLNRQCSRLSSETGCLKERLKNAEEKVKILETEAQRQESSRLEDDKYKDEVGCLRNELTSRHLQSEMTLSDKTSANLVQRDNEMLTEMNSKLSEELEVEKKLKSRTVLENKTLKKQLVEAVLEKVDLEQQLLSETEEVREQLKNGQEESYDLQEEKEMLSRRCSELEEENEIMLKEKETLQQELISKKKQLNSAHGACITLEEEKETLGCKCSELEEELECKLKEKEILEQEMISKERNMQEFERKLDCVLEESDRVKLDFGLASGQILQLNQELAEKIQENEKLQEVIRSNAMSTEMFHEKLLGKEKELAKFGKALETALFGIDQLKEGEVFKDRAIGKLEAEIQDKVMLLATLKESMTHKESELEEARKKLVSTSNNLQELREDIQAKMVKIDILHKEIQHHRNAAEATKHTLCDKEDIILDLDRKLQQTSERVLQLQEEAEKSKELQLNSEEIKHLKEENKKLCLRLEEEVQLQEDLKEDVFNFQTAAQASMLWEREAADLQKQLDELRAKETVGLGPNAGEVIILRQKCAELQNEKDGASSDAKVLRQKYDKLKEYYTRTCDENKKLKTTVDEMGEFLRRRQERASVRVQTDVLYPLEDDVLHLQNEMSTLQQRLLSQDTEITKNKETIKALKHEIKKREAQGKDTADAVKKDNNEDENWDMIEYGGSGFINRLQVCQMHSEVLQLQKENKKLKESLKRTQFKSKLKENVPIDVKSSPAIPSTKVQAAAVAVGGKSSTGLLKPSNKIQLNVADAPTLEDDVTLTVLGRPRLTVFSNRPVEKKEDNDDCNTQ